MSFFQTEPSSRLRPSAPSPLAPSSPSSCRRRTRCLSSRTARSRQLEAWARALRPAPADARQRRQRLKLNCNRLGLPLEDNRLRFRRNGNWLGLDVRDCGRGLRLGAPRERQLLLPERLLCRRVRGCSRFRFRRSGNRLGFGRNDDRLQARPRRRLPAQRPVRRAGGTSAPASTVTRMRALPLAAGAVSSVTASASASGAAASSASSLARERHLLLPHRLVGHR